MISVKNLMIGDWVRFNDSNYQVQVIKKKGVIKLYEMTQYGEHDIQLNTDFIEDFIEPILLTEELLYKNSFAENDPEVYRVYNTEYYVQYCLSDKYTIKYWKESNVFTYEGLEIKYVHELQHLIKLMNLNREIVL